MSTSMRDEGPAGSDDGNGTQRASGTGGRRTRKPARVALTNRDGDVEIMSKKGQKGRSRKKKPTTATSTEQPVVEAVAPVTPEPAVELSPPFAPTAPGASHAAASIPPVDLDSHFFESASRHEVPDDGIEEHEERDPRMVLKLAPATARRRAQLQRYVRFAVGAASVLCLAALVKVAVAHNHEEPTVRRAPATTQVAPPPV